MSRIPPGLLYLAVYNPNLPPSSLTLPDDEGAEERAQILFYTARERAVTRDRMLRQVGLAKALVSFSEMFTSEHTCENVHSQTRRMITVSPEPDYWIHACIELAKTPRPPLTKGKGKEKNNTKQDESALQQEQAYEYHDASVHDAILRSHIIEGYEDFKLAHGSFTSILSTLGQQGLEFQLERFFTVWAWRWDIVYDANFAADLGIMLHPAMRELGPMVDNFVDVLPEGACAFVLAPPYTIPSTRFSNLKYPTSLVRHVKSCIPRAPERPDSIVPDASEMPNTITTDLVPLSTDSRGLGPAIVSQVTQQTVESAAVNSFAALTNMTRAMNPRQLRWVWPGYFSLGKTTEAPTSLSTPIPVVTTHLGMTEPSEADAEYDKVEHNRLDVPGTQKRSMDVDRESLQEALSTDSTSISPPQKLSLSSSPIHLDGSPPLKDDKDETSGSTGVSESLVEEPTSREIPSVTPAGKANEDTAEKQLESESEGVYKARLPGADSPSSLLRSSVVHLTDSMDTQSTCKRRVWYFTKALLTLAIITDQESQEPSEYVPRAIEMLRVLQGHLDVQASTAEKPLPSANTILQPQSTHLIALDGYTVSSDLQLPRDPEHLYNAKRMFHADRDVLEVFSRGQNPQHWHIAKRGLGVSSTEQSDYGEVYMEIARKESTLVDVDNELAAIVRIFAEQVEVRV